ncbi:MAG: diacylglycerol/lipid kinase family protein [Gaiellales bacterium]
MTPGSKPEAVLIVNPNAGRLSESKRQETIDALRARFNLHALATTARGSGIEIGAEAAERTPLVIAFGGDGHVNEVANGVAGTNSSLGIIPGGTMNVFSRSLGIPPDPLDAVNHVARMARYPPRRVPLGKLEDRYFTFSAGCGFDAEAAERVERYVPFKRRFGELFFYWSAFRVLADSYRHRTPTMVLTGGFGQIAVSMMIASNAGPYAYLMGRPIAIAPNVKLESGIDVFGLKTMRIEALPLYAWRCLLSGDLVNHPDAFYASDQHSFTVEAEEPFSRHVDGEPLAPSRTAHFSVAPDVLSVQA